MRNENFFMVPSLPRLDLLLAVEMHCASSTSDVEEIPLKPETSAEFHCLALVLIVILTQILKVTLILTGPDPNSKCNPNLNVNLNHLALNADTRWEFPCFSRILFYGTLSADCRILVFPMLKRFRIKVVSRS